MKTMLSTEDVTRAALTAAVKTFESMAFIDVSQTAAVDISSCGQVFYIAIAIKAPWRGHLVLYLPEGGKKKILENIYGRDFEDLSETEINDCLLEILNVLAGNFMSLLYGESADFQLGFPKVVLENDSVLQNNTEPLCLFFDAEGETFKIGIELEDQK